jgi:NTE family protein
VGSPCDLANRRSISTDAWLAQHGLQQGKIPHAMRLRSQ